MSQIFRVYVEKRSGYDIEAVGLLNDLKESLGISLEKVRLFQRYDICGISKDEFEQARNLVFAEPMVDDVYDEDPPAMDGRAFAIEYLPGQYDQRADSAAQCVQLLTGRDMPIVHTARVYALSGNISEKDFLDIKSYMINPIETREASFNKPESLEMVIEKPEKVKNIDGFISMDNATLSDFHKSMGLAMSLDDLDVMQSYFKNDERRDPTITELKVIDTYWSDHCRHTTFRTKLTNVTFEDELSVAPIKMAWDRYLDIKAGLSCEKPVTLMDIAVTGMKELKRAGKLDDLDESDEINACSIKVDVDVNGKTEPWLVMFKNETHNHPTEIEPFGGAATCLGGAIRDPLSGRCYVYQAMRVTGSADPRARIEDTLSGKLPQKKITTTAAAGYSSYGNQIGLATGKVAEIYHPGYVAKRMEVGAVVAAGKLENVVRLKPEEGDVIILVGGRTGRDGCGGATGSSVAHTEDSIKTCGAEVQKGNAPTERKLQRLFRRSEAAKLIKKCNDFGAGGVSVAVGELADGMEIDLDKVPKKYEGLDGTELAISESQERMAVVISPCDLDAFIKYASEENLEATAIARVTNDKRMTIKWQNETIVSLTRDFLDSNGADRENEVRVNAPIKGEFFDVYRSKSMSRKPHELENEWINNLSDLNVCSQRGLGERFGGSIGAATVHMPFGGSTQLTPVEAMIAKLPVLNGETTTGTSMAFGFNPYLSTWSPFHGAVFAIVEAVSKVAASGGDWRTIRLSLQEYFEKLNDKPSRWGKPLAALLGALQAQMELEIPAIGGKDSVSGTFKDLDVPPTLIAFAITPFDVTKAVSCEFKSSNSDIWLLDTPLTSDDLIDFDILKRNLDGLNELIKEKSIKAARAVDFGGISAAITEMALGNWIGADLFNIESFEIFAPMYGSFVLEASSSMNDKLSAIGAVRIGTTNSTEKISVMGVELDLADLKKAWSEPLEKIFPTCSNLQKGTPIELISDRRTSNGRSKIKIAKPRVLIPVFPGTNCEYDTYKAFTKAGADAQMYVIKNLTSSDIKESAIILAENIKNSQILALPGGFSAGDEPDGSGKFIATMLRNPYVKEAVMDLLKNRDGLILGICNGFQALIKLGLVPYGEIKDLGSCDPTLTFNVIGRHISRHVSTRVASTLSPWMAKHNVGDIHSIAICHGEGRFVANDSVLQALKNNGQIATQYVKSDGTAVDDETGNPNGSVWAIEGITSPDGRVFGKMGHSERAGENVFKNITGDKDQRIFEAGVEYFTS